MEFTDDIIKQGNDMIVGLNEIKGNKSRATYHIRMIKKSIDVIEKHEHYSLQESIKALQHNIQSARMFVYNYEIDNMRKFK